MALRTWAWALVAARAAADDCGGAAPEVFPPDGAVASGDGHHALYSHAAYIRGRVDAGFDGARCDLCWQISHLARGVVGECLAPAADGSTDTSVSRDGDDGGAYAAELVVVARRTSAVAARSNVVAFAFRNHPCGAFTPRISPPDGATPAGDRVAVAGREALVRGTIEGVLDVAECEVCWQMSHASLGAVGDCTTVDPDGAVRPTSVEWHANGAYEVVLRVVPRVMGAAGAVVVESRTVAFEFARLKNGCDARFAEKARTYRDLIKEDDALDAVTWGEYGPASCDDFREPLTGKTKKHLYRRTR